MVPAENIGNQQGDVSMEGRAGDSVTNHEEERPKLAPAELESRTQFYHDRLFPSLPWWFLPFCPLGLYLGTVAVVCWVRLRGGAAWQPLSVVLIAIWTVGPPAWFLVEYFRMPYIPIDRLPNIEAFKYTREMARDFWIAAVALLAALAGAHLSGAGE